MVSEFAGQSPLLIGVVVGLVGGILLVAGGRWYHRGIALAAFAVGAMATSAAMLWLAEVVASAGQPLVVMVGALVGGISVAAAARMAHRLALVLIGAVAGLVLGGSAVQWLAAPAWVAGIGLLIGGLVAPFVYDRMLKIVTPAVGAVAIAWALGRPDSLILLAALWAFGAAVQLAGQKRSAGVEERQG